MLRRVRSVIGRRSARRIAGKHGAPPRRLHCAIGSRSLCGALMSEEQLLIISFLTIVSTIFVILEGDIQ